MTPKPTKKTVYLETFGCQMNELDSELIASQMRALGWDFTPDWQQADVVLYNTCSVREQAEQKVWSRLGIIGKSNGLRRDAVLGVLGCMAERDGRDLLRKFPHVDILCGPGELDQLPLLIDNVTKTREPAIALQGDTSRRAQTLAAAEDSLERLDLSRVFDPGDGMDRSRSAYVRITRGCNKFCSYCVVPLTRGAEVHRPPDAIVEECRRLVDAGVVEVTLLGQTVNHYRFEHDASVVIDGIQQPQKGRSFKGGHRRDPIAGGRVTTFAGLLERIHKDVPELARLRFVTSYPRDFGDDILEVMRDCPRICRYLHVPVQSASNRILELMNRGYTIEEYKEFIGRVREHLPDATIASDIIVGFPTETEADFELTAELLRWARFKNCFIFKYSQRPGTPADQRLVDDIPDEVKRLRNNALLSIQGALSAEVHQSYVGRTVDVFIEGLSTRQSRKMGLNGAGRANGRGTIGLTIAGQSLTTQGNGLSAPVDGAADELVQLSGRTSGDLIAVFDVSADRAEELIGRIVRVTIDEARSLTLKGHLAGEQGPG